MPGRAKPKSWSETPATLDRIGRVMERWLRHETVAQIAKAEEISESTVKRDVARGEQIIAGYYAQDTGMLAARAIAERRRIVDKAWEEVKALDDKNILMALVDRVDQKRKILGLILQVEDSVAGILRLNQSPDEEGGSKVREIVMVIDSSDQGKRLAQSQMALEGRVLRGGRNGADGQ